MAGRLQELFESAIGLRGPEREAYLRGACGEDRSLRAEIDELLSAHDRAAGFMGSPTVQQPPKAAFGSDATLMSPPPEGPGTRIGPYKILELIGEGGFGSVFMAEQSAPVQRRVALKIIKLGMDTRQVVARFEQERQALAIMDHPNIARVLDAGATESGRPFFVMELVKGEPIVAYCDKHNLSVQDRLELFAQVCAAVQHAHTKGIIHRDLKPSNILVSTQDNEPHAKVIDFGIAKATAGKLTERTLFTEHRQLIGTPEYMSPEQAEGSLDIDTRTDVFSLGVLLYELLTGTTPFTSRELRSAAYAEMQRIIREVDPPRPSTRLSLDSERIASVATQRRCEPSRLGALVRGELDWIVMKSLEKDRRRRYESASALASDIRRHLNKEPVQAGPPDAAYKFRKFVQRNRGKVAAAGVVAATLVLGLVGTSIGLMKAVEQRARADEAAERAIKAAAAETKAKEEAQHRLGQVERATDILSSVFESLDPREIARSGRPLQAVLAENLDKAVKDLDGGDIGDSRAVLKVQAKLGRSLLSLGEAAKAITVLERALENATQALGPEDPSTLAFSGTLAMAYGAAGKYTLAIPMLEHLVAKLATTADRAPDALSLAKHNLALFYRELGRAVDALPLLEDVAKARRADLGPDHPYTLSTLNALATTYDDLGKRDLALPLFEETVEAYKRTLGAEHPSTLAAMNNLGTAYQRRGDFGKAIPLIEEVLRVSREKFGSSSPNTLATLSNLGFTYRKAGMGDKAVVVLEEALMLMRTRHGDDYPNTVATMTNLASAYWSLGKFDKSVPLYEEAFKLYDRSLGRHRPETLMAMANLGVNYSDAGRFAEALPLLEEAHAAAAQDRDLSFVDPVLASVYAQLGRYEQAASAVPVAVEHQRRTKPERSAALAGGLANCAGVLLKCGRGAEAEALLREVVSIRVEVQPDAWNTFYARSMLGEALTMQKKYSDAEAMLVEGYNGLKAREQAIPSAAGPRMAEALDRLIALYGALNKPDDAKRWAEERAKYPGVKSPEKK